MARHSGAQATVFKYFSERPNKLVFLVDVEKTTSLPGKVIQNAISQLRFKGEVIEVNVRGSAWTYRPDAKPVDATTVQPAGPHIPNPGVLHLMCNVKDLGHGRFFIEVEGGARAFIGWEI